MEFPFTDTVDDLSKVPEQFRSLYAPVEGGSGAKLLSDKPEVKGAVEAIVGLGKALKAARTDADTARKSKIDLSPLKEWGEDPTVIATSVQAKLKELQDQLAKGSSAKLDLEALRQDMAKAHTKDKESWEARIKGLQDQLFTHLVESSAKTAISAQKGDLDLLLPFVKARVKTVEEDGQIKVYVTDESNTRRYGATGQDMTIAELVAEMKASTRYSKLFESEAPRGGGTTPGAPGHKGVKEPVELTANQKISVGLSKNQHVGAGAPRSRSAGGPGVRV